MELDAGTNPNKSSSLLVTYYYSLSKTGTRLSSISFSSKPKIISNYNITQFES